MTKAERKDARDHLQAQWLDDLENGVAPWTKPWTTGEDLTRPQNLESGRKYRGTNVWVLLWEQVNQGYPTSHWITFSGIKRQKGFVKKGESPTWILQPVPKFFYRDVEDEDNPGTFKKVKIQYMDFKGLKVWNVAQTTLEIPTVEEPTEQEKKEAIAHVEEFIAAQGSKVTYGSSKAAYSPLTDSIQMPNLQDFEDEASFYSTNLHEHAHWTMHEDRCNRETGDIFDKQSYAFEELVAEMTAAYLCLDLGIEGKLQHREYIGNWVKVIEENKKAITKAASLAEQAAEWLTENAAKVQEAVAA